MHHRVEEKCHGKLSPVHIYGVKVFTFDVRVLPVSTKNFRVIIIYTSLRTYLRVLPEKDPQCIGLSTHLYVHTHFAVRVTRGW